MIFSFLDLKEPQDLKLDWKRQLLNRKAFWTLHLSARFPAGLNRHNAHLLNSIDMAAGGLMKTRRPAIKVLLLYLEIGNLTIYYNTNVQKGF